MDAPTYLRREAPADNATHMLEHMKQSAVPPAAPPASTAAAAHSGVDDYAGGWLRLRNVDVIAEGWGGAHAGGIGNGTSPMSVLLGGESQVTRLPDYHAAVAALTPPLPPQQQHQQQQPAALAHVAPHPPPLPQRPPPQAHVPAAPAPVGAPAPAPAPAPPSASAVPLLPPGQAEAPERRGAHGQVHSRPASDMALPSLLQHQRSGPRPQPSNPTVLTEIDLGVKLLESMPVLSLKQAMDAHASAPCLMRVRARARRALPTNELLWTVPSASDDGHVYRMVLELCDESDWNARLGAPLTNEHATCFFHGLPPCDLTIANASLMQLKSIVHKLTHEDSSPTEFCLWACRPDAADTSATGVAYHVVATRCVAASA